MYYIVRNGSGDVVLIATRKEDADAYTTTQLDETPYTIEVVEND